MSGVNPAIRELDWYLRDHFFRQTNAGKTSFRLESLPNEMVTLYLRYRGTDPATLVEGISDVIATMLSRHAIEHDGNELSLSGKLTRLQCAGCFYINYLTDAEPRVCMRCGGTSLHDFPKKKA